MPKVTGGIALSSTYQNITVGSVCDVVIVREDKSVSGYPTAQVKFRGSSADGDEILQLGEEKRLPAPLGKKWQVNDVAGQWGVVSGTSTGVQIEQP